MMHSRKEYHISFSLLSQTDMESHMTGLRIHHRLRFKEIDLEMYYGQLQLPPSPADRLSYPVAWAAAPKISS